MVLQGTGHAYSLLPESRTARCILVQPGTRIGRKDTDPLTAQEDKYETEHFNANGVLFHAGHYDLNWLLHDAMLTTGYRQKHQIHQIHQILVY